MVGCKFWMSMFIWVSVWMFVSMTSESVKWRFACIWRPSFVSNPWFWFGPNWSVVSFTMVCSCSGCVDGGGDGGSRDSQPLSHCEWVCLLHSWAIWSMEQALTLGRSLLDWCDSLGPIGPYSLLSYLYSIRFRFSISSWIHPFLVFDQQNI